MASCFFIYKKLYTYETKLVNVSKALVLLFIYCFNVRWTHLNNKFDQLFYYSYAICTKNNIYFLIIQ